MLIHHSDITKCCKGKQKTAGGYIWKYAIKFNVFDLAIEKLLQRDRYFFLFFFTLY